MSVPALVLRSWPLDLGLAVVVILTVFAVSRRPTAESARPAPTRGIVEFESLGSDPAIDWEGSIPVIEAAEQSLSACYERALPRNPSTQWDQGRLDLLLRIGPDGEVTKARVHGVPESLEDYRRCFEDRARDWKFPKPSMQPAALVAEFSFELRDVGARDPRPESPPHNRVYPSRIEWAGLDSGYALTRALDQREDIDACYDAFLRRTHASGELEVELEIDHVGRPSSIEVSAPSRRFNRLIDCVMAKVKAWRFEPDRSRARTLKLTYELRADVPERPRGRAVAELASRSAVELTTVSG